MGAWKENPDPVDAEIVALPTQNGYAWFIDTVHLKHRLGQIEADRDN